MAADPQRARHRPARFRAPLTQQLPRYGVWAWVGVPVGAKYAACGAVGVAVARTWPSSPSPPNIARAAARRGAGAAPTRARGALPGMRSAAGRADARACSESMAADAQGTTPLDSVATWTYGWTCSIISEMAGIGTGKETRGLIWHKTPCREVSLLCVLENALQSDHSVTSVTETSTPQRLQVCARRHRDCWQREGIVDC